MKKLSTILRVCNAIAWILFGLSILLLFVALGVKDAYWIIGLFNIFDIVVSLFLLKNKRIGNGVTMLILNGLILIWCLL